MKLILLRKGFKKLGKDYGFYSDHYLIPAIAENVTNNKGHQLVTSVVFKNLKDFKLAYKQTQHDVIKFLNKNNA